MATTARFSFSDDGSADGVIEFHRSLRFEGVKTRFTGFRWSATQS
jgi:hypothetical protein